MKPRKAPTLPARDELEQERAEMVREIRDAERRATNPELTYLERSQAQKIVAISRQQLRLLEADMRRAQ